MNVSEIKAAETEYLIFRLAYLFDITTKWARTEEERVIKELCARLNLSQEKLTALFKSL